MLRHVRICYGVYLPTCATFALHLRHIHFQIRPVSPASTISSSLRQEAGNRHQSTVDNMMRKWPASGFTDSLKRLRAILWILQVITAIRGFLIFVLALNSFLPLFQNHSMILAHDHPVLEQLQAKKTWRCRPAVWASLLGQNMSAIYSRPLSY